MATANDFLEDSNLDELITDGDYVVGRSDFQHIDDIIVSAPGAWREYPTCGVAIQQFQSSAGQKQTIERIINQQLTADGVQNIFIGTTETTNGIQFNVNGQYI